MPRYNKRRYDDDEDDFLAKFISVFVILYILSLWYFYKTNRATFWHWLFYGIIIVVAIVALIVGFSQIKQKRAKQHVNKLSEQISAAGQNDYIDNFISRFGYEAKKNNGWSFRNYFFDWERINDLEKVLREKGIELKHNEEQKDIYAILRHYIQEREESLTRESIKKVPQKFTDLSGSGFEKLLYRLYQAMGYSVQLIGKSGDQGGDLITNKDGERTLIQAKCYRDWSTGNAAIQQVVGAMKFYDCNKATVITTTYFTAEAIALAKTNNTELISKAKLQELLMQYLQESWT